MTTKNSFDGVEFKSDLRFEVLAFLSFAKVEFEHIEKPLLPFNSTLCELITICSWCALSENGKKRLLCWQPNQSADGNTHIPQVTEIVHRWLVYDIVWWWSWLDWWGTYQLHCIICILLFSLCRGLGFRTTDVLMLLPDCLLLFLLLSLLLLLLLHLQMNRTFFFALENEFTLSQKPTQVC